GAAAGRPPGSGSGPAVRDRSGSSHPRASEWGRESFSLSLQEGCGEAIREGEKTKVKSSKAKVGLFGLRLSTLDFELWSCLTGSHRIGVRADDADGSAANRAAAGMSPFIPLLRSWNCSGFQRGVAAVPFAATGGILQQTPAG